jgi:hypothetical protein
MEHGISGRGFGGLRASSREHMSLKVWDRQSDLSICAIRSRPKRNLPEGLPIRVLPWNAACFKLLDQQTGRETREV